MYGNTELAAVFSGVASAQITEDLEDLIRYLDLGSRSCDSTTVLGIDKASFDLD